MTEESIATARELATHAADIQHLQLDLDKMSADLREIKKCLASISTTLSEARGGWKVMMLVAGVSGAIGAALTQVASFWHGR
jgi:prefoldin subunit 5